MRISYLGPQGTFTEEALQRYCAIHGIEGKRQPISTIDGAIEACMLDEADVAFVPVENSLGGSVLTTMDYLTEHDDVAICGEITMPIRHYAWGIPGSELAGIRQVYSHPQALRQCKRFLTDRLAQADCHETASTSEAGRWVADKGDTAMAAIGGLALGQTYGLKRLTDEIQDNTLNVTRFIMVRHGEASLTKPEGEVHKLSLLCELDGLRPGSLYEGLAIFAKRGINLVRIESRPTKGRLGEYKFFFDLDMSTGYDNVSAAVEELRQTATAVQLFGMYQSIAVE